MESKNLPLASTVSIVSFRVIDDQLSLLFSTRTENPYKGEHLFPSGLIYSREPSREAHDRILKAKTGIEAKNLNYVEQLHTFDTSSDSPRGHTLEVAYLSCSYNAVPDKSLKYKPAFVPVNDIANLPPDNMEIFEYAMRRLREKFAYTNIAFSLLPDSFTFSVLQELYETVLERSLDKRNFRKKIERLNLVEETGQKEESVSHRPAKLYRFKNKRYQTFSIDW